MTPLLLCCLLWPSLGEAQTDRRARKLQAERLETWPPERAYSHIALGYALQKVFEKHYNLCGFPAVNGKRDFTPPTIEQFLGKRTLRTKVEQANLSGGNLLNYIFRLNERDAPLDAIQFQSDRLLALDQVETAFMPQPRVGFDAFVMTKNCSGYLKACLDAGIKPPYTAFSTALSNDDRRQSSVLALAGSFVSPLAEVLAARDSRTTELLARLWLFYQQHPEYIGQAYYLREFEGVLVKHLSTAEAVAASEQQLGVNVNLPFAARFNTSITRGRSNSLSFSGTDWQTIITLISLGPTKGKICTPFYLVHQKLRLISANCNLLLPTPLTFLVSQKEWTTGTSSAFWASLPQWPGCPGV
ncbi:MAG: hypothetical protein HC821_05390 [Lewinella sp.]|nr:hypothetical protein [Lewinella sp.]